MLFVTYTARLPPETPFSHKIKEFSLKMYHFSKIWAHVAPKNTNVLQFWLRKVSPFHFGHVFFGQSSNYWSPGPYGTGRSINDSVLFTYHPFSIFLKEKT